MRFDARRIRELRAIDNVINGDKDVKRCGKRSDGEREGGKREQRDKSLDFIAHAHTGVLIFAIEKKKEKNKLSDD